MTDLTIEAQANLLRKILTTENDEGSRELGWGASLLDGETLSLDTVTPLTEDEAALVRAICSLPTPEPERV